MAHLKTVICWCVLMYVVGREICLDLAVHVHFCHSNNFFPMPMCFCASLVKSTNRFRRYSANKAHFYSLYSVVPLKIRSRS